MTGLDLRSLPKAELHLHFEAAMSRESAVALADRSGLPAPATGPFPDLSAFVVAYERARVEVTYKPLEVGAGGEARDLGAENLATSSEVYSFPRDEATFKWAGDGKPLPPEATGGKIVTTVTPYATKYARASFSVFNTHEEVETALDAVRKLTS